MTVTDIAPAAPPGFPHDAAVTAPTPADRSQEVASLTADLDQARKDLAAVVRDNLVARRRLAERDDRYLAALADRDDHIRELLNAVRVKDAAIARHERAVQALAAVELEAAGSRHPGTHALLIAAVCGALATVGLIAAGVGFAEDWLAVVVAGLVLTGPSLASLALLCASPHAGHDDEAAGRD